MTTITQTYAGMRAPATRSLWALITTDASSTQTLLRLTLGLVLLPHGAQHLLGALGGYGFSATVHWMTGTLGIPAPLAAIGIVVEFVGPLLLLFGAASRIAALALAIFMTTAGSTHLVNGFFMNWFGKMPAGVEGFEYHILAVALAIAIAVNGGGAWSVDRVLSRQHGIGRKQLP